MAVVGPPPLVPVGGVGVVVDRSPPGCRRCPPHQHSHPPLRPHRSGVGRCGPPRVVGMVVVPCLFFSWVVVSFGTGPSVWLSRGCRGSVRPPHRRRRGHAEHGSVLVGRLVQQGPQGGSEGQSVQEPGQPSRFARSTRSPQASGRHWKRGEDSTTPGERFFVGRFDADSRPTQAVRSPVGRVPRDTNRRTWSGDSAYQWRTVGRWTMSCLCEVHRSVGVCAACGDGTDCDWCLVGSVGHSPTPARPIRDFVAPMRKPWRCTRPGGPPHRDGRDLGSGNPPGGYPPVSVARGRLDQVGGVDQFVAKNRRRPVPVPNQR